MCRHGSVISENSFSNASLPVVGEEDKDVDLTLRICLTRIGLQIHVRFVPSMWKFVLRKEGPWTIWRLDELRRGWQLVNMASRDFRLSLASDADHWTMAGLITGLAEFLMAMACTFPPTST